MVQMMLLEAYRFLPRGYTVKSAISGTPGTKGLPDFAIFFISEYYT
jgi:hypothetical protein